MIEPEDSYSIYEGFEITLNADNQTESVLISNPSILTASELETIILDILRESRINRLISIAKDGKDFTTRLSPIVDEGPAIQAFNGTVHKLAEMGAAAQQVYIVPDVIGRPFNQHLG